MIVSVANRVALEACVQARNEGRDLDLLYRDLAPLIFYSGTGQLNRIPIAIGVI